GNGPVCTTGAGAVPGATANVSVLKRPRNVPFATPLASLVRSPWYHEMPNGASGTWITNRSNPVLAGRPVALTVITSTPPCEVMLMAALPCGTQPAATAAEERTMLNVVVGTAAPPVDASTPKTTAAAASPVTAPMIM